MYYIRDSYTYSIWLTYIISYYIWLIYYMSHTIQIYSSHTIQIYCISGCITRHAFIILIHIHMCIFICLVYTHTYPYLLWIISVYVTYSYVLYILIHIHICCELYPHMLWVMSYICIIYMTHICIINDSHIWIHIIYDSYIIWVILHIYNTSRMKSKIISCIQIVNHMIYIMLFTSFEDSNTLRHSATRCNALQRTATHCNTNHMVYIKSAPFSVLHLGPGT